MSKVTIEDIDRQIAEQRMVIAERNERIWNCEVEDTDCFLSMKADRLNIDLLETQRRILENGGMAEFTAYETLDGVPVEAKLVDTKYGRKLVADMPDGSTVWTSALTEKGLAKRNLKEVKVMRPAWAKIDASGWYGNMYVKVYQTRLNRATGEYR